MNGEKRWACAGKKSHILVGIFSFSHNKMNQDFLKEVENKKENSQDWHYHKEIETLLHHQQKVLNWGSLSGVYFDRIYQV